MSDLEDLMMGVIEGFLHNPDMLQKAAKGAYRTSPINGRRRATKEEIADRKQALYYWAREETPVTIRRLFYRAATAGLVAKDQKGYKKIQSTLVRMRRDGDLPYNWIADSTRWMRKPATHNSLEAAIADTAAHYRRAVWSNADIQIEVWLEKDALAGVIYPVTSKYDVPLMVARGFASLSFLHHSAMALKRDGRPAVIYHLGDSDTSGRDAAAAIERDLKEFAPELPIQFEILAVTDDQIDEMDLPTRPDKKSGKPVVELDAINANDLRDMVESAITAWLPENKMKVLQVAEASERQLLEAWSDAIDGGLIDIEDETERLQTLAEECP